MSLASVYSNMRPSDDSYRVFFAAYYNDMDALKFLKSHGAIGSTEIFDKDGRTPLAIAAS